MPEQKDPNVDSEFARGKAKAQAAGVPPGVDPETKERAAITYRQLYNETKGEDGGAVARNMFQDIARAGGYGDVALDQALDIKGLKRSVDDRKKALDKGLDFETGQPLDLYGKHKAEQAIQHQDNVMNDVHEMLKKHGIEKG